MFMKYKKIKIKKINFIFLIIFNILSFLYLNFALALSIEGVGDKSVRDKVIALYRFNSANVTIGSSVTSGSIVKDISGNGDPLNLEIIKPYAQIDSDFIQFSDPNVMKSIGPADKIVNACKASNEMTIELWIQPLTTSERLVNHEDEKRSFKEAMRIVSLGDNYFKEYNNFMFSHTYNMGDAYKASITTTENSKTSIRGGLINSFVTNREALNVNQLQHIYVVRNKAGLLKVYSSTPDSDDPKKLNVFITSQETRTLRGTFGGMLSNWYSSGGTVTLDTPTDNLGVKTKTLDIRLAFGNEPSSSAKIYLDPSTNTYKSELDSIPKFNRDVPEGEYFDQDGKPLDPGLVYPKAHSRNHFWKGKFYMAAIYCTALSDFEILGPAAPHLDKMPSFAIDLNTQVTPELKKALTIYSRINSVSTPLSNPRLKKMESLIRENKLIEAATAAIEDSTDGRGLTQDIDGTFYNPSFYNITVRDFATPMSNRDESVGASLNDFVATVVGATRNNYDARKLLYTDIVFKANYSKAAVPSDVIRDILSSNNHYESLQKGGFDLVRVLEPTTQKMIKCANPNDDLIDCINNNQAQVVSFPEGEAAGLLTSRAFMQSHAIAGTNRRMLQYSFQEFLCTPMETWSNTSRSEAPTGRDVDRFPGGSHSKFLSSCKGCHSGMDPLRPAFAYFTFSNNFIKHSSISGTLNPTDMDEDTKVGMKVGIKNDDPALKNYTPTQLRNVANVASKYNHNDNIFPNGHVTVDNSWYNAATEKWSMDYFGWQGPMSGQGASSFGKMIAESKKFPNCMAQRVFKTVCKRDVKDFDRNLINTAADEFVKNNYNLKHLFKRIVISKECIGE